MSTPPSRNTRASAAVYPGDIRDHISIGIHSHLQSFYGSSMKRISWLVIALWRVTIGRWVFIKPARDAKTEIATMRFVRAQTTIRVPRPITYLPWRGRDYIFMERVPGEELQFTWTKLSPQTQESIITQLADYIAQLRSIPPPLGSTAVCSILGGPFLCCRLHSEEPSGPFRDEDQMNLQLRNLHEVTDCAPVVAASHSIRHPLVFTHNDLFPRNVMYGDGILTLIDWESAGWFPAHWEYCKSMNWGDWSWLWTGIDWRGIIKRTVPNYELEASADKELLTQFFQPEVHAL